MLGAQIYMLGAQRLRLSTIGLMQYLAPTMQFILGVFVFGETFTMAHGIAFASIWTVLAVFTHDLWRRSRRAAPPAASAA